jgi:hypothetical protein
MLYRVKLVGKGASIRRGRVVVGGERVLGVSVLIPSLLYCTAFVRMRFNFL